MSGRHISVHPRVSSSSQSTRSQGGMIAAKTLHPVRDPKGERAEIPAGTAVVIVGYTIPGGEYDLGAVQAFRADLCNGVVIEHAGSRYRVRIGEVEVSLPPPTVAEVLDLLRQLGRQHGGSGIDQEEYQLRKNVLLERILLRLMERRP